MTFQNKRLLAIISITTIILLIPLIAMQFSSEVDWELNDFVIMGMLLLGTGCTVELIIRNVKTKRYRLLLTIITLAILILVWMELAVGIFGTPFAGS